MERGVVEKAGVVKPCKMCGEPRAKDDLIFRDGLCEDCRLRREIDREEQRETRRQT